MIVFVRQAQAELIFLSFLFRLLKALLMVVDNLIVLF